MSITSKYGFKVSMNQFGQPVPSDHHDESEQILIDKFEEYTVGLKSKGRSNYSMIELGSDHAYYSLLFKHILGVDVTTNIMVEPFTEHMERGKHHFNINGVDGHFIDKCVNTSWVLKGTTFDTDVVTLKELLDQHNINDLDVLHCDIDGSELNMLITNTDVFDKQLINYVYLLTHSPDLHKDCKSFLLEKKYELLLDHNIQDVGYDSLLIFKRPTINNN